MQKLKVSNKLLCISMDIFVKSVPFSVELCTSWQIEASQRMIYLKISFIRSPCRIPFVA
jgi:hypothetical protein